MYAWILQHDDRWSFIALYVSLAVVLSMWISLFWLVALVVVHFAFECVRQAAAGAEGAEVPALAVWEVKLDIALVLFALALSIYMDVVLGLLGLQAVARAGAVASASARAGSRVLAWERAIRGVLLSADDAAQVARVMARRAGNGSSGGGSAAIAGAETQQVGSAATADAETQQVGEAGAVALQAPPRLRAEPGDRHGPADEAVEPRLVRSSGWQGAWATGDRVALGLAAACIVLMVASPVLTETTYAQAFATMLGELHPFPPR